MQGQARARQLALTGIIGPALFAMAIVVGAHLENGYLGGDAYRPGLHGGYSHVYSFVSELAATGSGVQVLMTGGFLAFGICIVAFAWSLRALRFGSIALALIVALSGLGTLLAGSFSCEAGCPASGPRSTSQQLHDATSLLTFSAWIIAALLAGWQYRRVAYGRVSLALGGIELAAGVVLASIGSGTRGADDPVGLLQRIMLGAVGAWFVVTTLAVRRASAREPATRELAARRGDATRRRIPIASRGDIDPSTDAGVSH